jgi:hypothetical protein
LEHEEIDLNQRFSILNYLTEDELVNLRDFCANNFSTKSIDNLSQINAFKIVNTSEPITKLKSCPKYAPEFVKA